MSNNVTIQEDIRGIIAERLSTRQVILQRRLPSQLGFVYTHVYVAIVSHTQECNYRLRSTHVRRSHGAAELEATLSHSLPPFS